MMMAITAAAIDQRRHCHRHHRVVVVDGGGKDTIAATINRHRRMTTVGSVPPPPPTTTTATFSPIALALTLPWTRTQRVSFIVAVVVIGGAVFVAFGAVFVSARRTMAPRKTAVAKDEAFCTKEKILYIDILQYVRTIRTPKLKKFSFVIF